MCKFIRAIKKIGVLGIIKSLVFNLRFFTIREAIHMPVLMPSNVVIKGMKRGKIVLSGEGNVVRAHLGINDMGHAKKNSCFVIKGKMVLKGIGYIYPGANVFVGEGAILTIGNNFSASHDLKLHCRKRITIGEDNMWSNNIIVMDNDGHCIYDESGNLANKNKEVVFGNHVWVACRCTIMKGSRIPDGCIIGADSLVNKSLHEENTVYAGNPIRQIKQDVSWSRTLA